MQPNFLDAWTNLGACLRELKRPADADIVFRKALELNPDNPEALDSLALALKDLDLLDEAAELARRALEVKPDSDKLHFHYGAILLDQRKLDEATAAVERAIALNTDNAEAVNLMGRIAFVRGDADAALTHSRRALVMKPDLAEAHHNVGNALKELGQLAGAQDAYREAIRLEPNVTGFYLNMAENKSFSPGDPDLVAMEAFAAKGESLLKAERMQLDFALGKAYADLKDYPRSFRHLLAGNAAKRSTISYNEAAVSALMRPDRGGIHTRAHRRQNGRRRRIADANFRFRHATFGHNSDRADYREPSVGAWCRRVGELRRRTPYDPRIGRQHLSIPGIRPEARRHRAATHRGPLCCFIAQARRWTRTASPTRCLRTFTSPD